VVVMMEAALTPLMEGIERMHEVKVFSLPSVDHPQFGATSNGVARAGGGGRSVCAAVGGIAGTRCRLGPEMVSKKIARYWCFAPLQLTRAINI
jgi:hypothetical protein